MLYCEYHFLKISAYKTCIEEENKKCTSTPLLVQNDTNQEDCEMLCDQFENCKFIFIRKSGSFCSLHETCHDFKTTNGVGNLLAKESCPGIMLLFLQI